MYHKLVETTDWGDHNIPNHTYFLQGTKLVGYIKQGTDKFIPYSGAYVFSKTRRKFTQSKVKVLPV